MAEDLFDPERFPENYYRGVIARLDRADFSGMILSDSGREIPFKFPFVTVVGTPPGGVAPGFRSLRIGDRIGFDVGRGSKGLMATTIKPL